MSDAALAVDLGGTNIRAALVTRDGQISHVVKCPTPAEEGIEAVIDRIAAALGEVIAHTHPASDVRVGVAAPGPLNPNTGVVYFAPNLPGWTDVPLQRILEERLNRGVVIGNDGNCAALGEHLFGAGRDVRNLVYIGLGTGIGGGIVSDGQLIEGIRGLGSEVGHVPIDGDGPRCTCGGIGCVESYAGGWAVARDGELVARSGRSTAILTAAGDGPITARVVAAAARAGDPEARAIYERAGRALGIGLATLVNLFNPELIVIGGGMAEAGDLIMAPLRQTFPRYAMRQFLPDVSIRESALGSDNGIYGAAASVFYRE